MRQRRPRPKSCAEVLGNKSNWPWWEFLQVNIIEWISKHYWLLVQPGSLWWKAAMEIYLLRSVHLRLREILVVLQPPYLGMWCKGKSKFLWPQTPPKLYSVHLSVAKWPSCSSFLPWSMNKYHNDMLIRTRLIPIGPWLLLKVKCMLTCAYTHALTHTPSLTHTGTYIYMQSPSAFPSCQRSGSRDISEWANAEHCSTRTQHFSQGYLFDKRYHVLHGNISR